MSSIDKVVAYLRVSTPDQNEKGVGLQAQQTAIEKACAQRSWTIVRTHVDVASGKTRERRAGLTQAVAELENGTAGTLMVSKLDRLSRSIMDFAHIMAEAQQNGWNIVALDLGVDLATPAGEFLASVMASAAQWERRIISQRTKDALAIKKAQGVRLGRPPADPATLALILRYRNNSWSYARIADQLNQDGIPTAQGGRHWYASSVHSVLAKSQI